VLVGEPGGVGPGVAQGEPGLHVPILDCAGDQPAGAAHDVPGERAAEPGGCEVPARRVGGDLLGGPPAGGAVAVDPDDQLGDVVGDELGGAGLALPARRNPGLAAGQ
jgi:hypothetical protein